MSSIIRGEDDFDSANAGGGGAASLAVFTVTGASQIDLTGFEDPTAYSGYIFALSNIKGTNDGNSLEMWVQNAGSYGTPTLKAGGFRMTDSATPTYVHDSGTNIKLSYSGNAANEYGHSGTVRWDNYHGALSASAAPSFQSNMGAYDRSRNYGVSQMFGQVQDIGGLSGVRFKCNVGSLVSGTITVHGIPL